MRFYKNLAPIRALSFDLDDTLYANPEVIARAELAMQQAIARQLPDFANNTPKYWHQLRWQLAEQHPEIRHDVSQWRLTALEQGLNRIRYFKLCGHGYRTIRNGCFSRSANQYSASP